MTASSETRDAIREANKRRKNCPKCGSANVEVRSDLNDDAHFAGVRYKICRACGHEVRVR